MRRSRNESFPLPGHAAVRLQPRHPAPLTVRRELPLCERQLRECELPRAAERTAGVARCCNSFYTYLQSWLREKAYVVTQAVRTKPMNVEFWRMVWELGSNCIVMLTKVFDFMRVRRCCCAVASLSNCSPSFRLCVSNTGH